MPGRKEILKTNKNIENAKYNSESEAFIVICTTFSLTWEIPLSEVKKISSRTCFGKIF